MATQRASRREYLALAVVLAMAGIFLLIIGHGLNFRHDDWDVVQYRNTGGIKTALEPLNGHLTLVPIVIYRFLFGTVGLSHYIWFRAVLVLYNLLCGLFLWRLLRRRLPAELALAGTTILVLCGPLYENYLFAIQIGQVGSLLGGLIAWNILDDTDRSRPQLLFLALAFSLMSSAIGVVVLLGAGVEVLLRRNRTYLITVVLAVGAFGAWYLTHGKSSEAIGLHQLPSFLSGLVAYTVVGTFSLWPLFHLSHAALRASAAVIILFGLALAWIGSQRRWFGAHAATLSARLPDWPRIADLLVVAVSYWVLTAAARTDLTPFRSRYIHPGAIVIVLLVAEFLAYRVIPSRTKVVASGLCAAILLLSIPFLARNAAKYRSASEILTAQITALQIARGDAPAGFQPSPRDDPQIRAALLFAAERTAGSSPAISPAALLRSPNSARAAADETLIRISLARPQVALPQCRQTSRRRPLIQGMSFPPGTALVLFNGSSTPAKVSLRRLASTPTELSSPVAAHRSIQIRLETDDVTAPWHITASVGSRLLVCSSA